MPLRIKCPTGHTLIVPEDRAGRTLRCPRCEQAVVVPGKASGSVPAKTSGGRLPPDDAPSPPAVNLPSIELPPTEPIPGVAIPPVVASSEVAPPPIAPLPPAVPDIVPEPPVIVPPPVVAAPSLALQAGSEKNALLVEPQTEPLTEQQESAAFAAVAVPDEPEPPPRKSPPEPPPVSAVQPVLPGVVPDRRRVLVVYQLAAAVVVAALFSIAPAVWDIVEYWRIPDSHFVARWALGLLFLGVVQLAYAVYVVQLPDWGSVWVVTLYSLALAALYAMVLGLTLISPEDGAVVRFLQLGDKIAGSKAALWCLCMVSVATLLAFFAGRLSVRWHQAEQVMRSVRS